jgi:hypothetical protein
VNEQPRSLYDLATTAVARHEGASGRELARKATDAGFTIASTTINHILAGTYRSRPGKATLDAFAWLAGVAPAVAYAAAGEIVSNRPFADELPPEADKLTPKQRAAVITVIRALLDPGVSTAGWDAGSRATKVDEDARYERFLGGFERFDALAERRFRQRQQDEYDAGIGRAARRGESTADTMRKAADRDAERPDDPGPDDGA